MERSAKPKSATSKLKASVACQTEGDYQGNCYVDEDDIIINEEVIRAVKKQNGPLLSDAAALASHLENASKYARLKGDPFHGGGLSHPHGPLTLPANPLLPNTGQVSAAQQHQNANPPSQPPPAAPPAVREIPPTTPVAGGTAAGEGSSKGKVKMNTYDVDESTLRVTIQGFSKMADTLCSEPKRIQDVPWRIMVMPKQHMVQKKSQKCMGFFLQCCPDNTYSDQWSCHAVAEMRLISEKPSVQNFVRKTTHVYTAKENDWGYSCFMTWADVLDENQGYIKADSVTLEISVKADGPKNMMSREEFRKTLDRWYELANMQMERGQIDKALEANAQAINNCKDKDDEYREKLDTQKETLVKQKLIESIQRIELGKDPSRPAETTTCPTSLRQALTGAQKTIAGTKVSEKRTANGTAKKERRGAAVVKQMRKKIENKNDKQRKQVDSSSEDLSKDKDGVEKKTVQTSVKAPAHDKSKIALEEQQRKNNLKQKALQDELRLAAETSLPPESSSDSESSEYAEDAGMTRNDLTECAGCEDRRSMTSADEDGEDEEGDEEEEEEEETDESADERIDVEGDDIPVDTKEMEVQTLESWPVRQRNDWGPHFMLPFAENPSLGITSSMEALSAIPPALTAQDLQRVKRDQMKKEQPRAARWLGVTDGMAEDIDMLCNEAHSMPEMASQLLDSSKFADIMLNNVMRKDIPTAHEQISEVTTVGMSVLNAEQFMRKLEPLFKCLEAIAEMDLVKSTLNRVFPNKQYPIRVCTSQFISAKGEDGEGDDEEEEIDCDDTGDRKRRRRRRYKTDELHESYHLLDVAVLRECTDDERLAHIRGLFHRELLAYNHMMVGMMERLDVLYRIADDVRIAMESKEISKIMDSHKRTELKLTDVENKVKTMEANSNREREHRKKLEAEKAAAQEKADEEKSRADTLTQQLKEKRNELRKVEKKQRQDENRVAELVSENAELEEKLKAAKREIDNLKKKATEERNKVRKDKEKDTEAIRRLEADLAEKEAEKERERSATDAKLRKLQHEEIVSTKERKSLQTQLQAATDRAKRAEVSQLEVELQSGLKYLDRGLNDCTAREEDVEAKIKSARTSSEVDGLRKSLQEWQIVRKELSTSIGKAKTEFTAAIESIKNGSKTLAHLNKPVVPSPPPAPKTVAVVARHATPPVAAVAGASSVPTPSATVLPTASSSAIVPPVQQPPSTPTPMGPIGSGHSHTATPAPVAPPPNAAGVIGQPRTPVPVRENTLHSAYHSPARPSAAVAPAPSVLQSPSTYSRAPSPPLTDSPVKANLPPIGVRLNASSAIPSSSSISANSTSLSSVGGGGPSSAFSSLMASSSNSIPNRSMPAPGSMGSNSLGGGADWGGLGGGWDPLSGSLSYGQFSSSNSNPTGLQSRTSSFGAPGGPTTMGGMMGGGMVGGPGMNVVPVGNNGGSSSTRATPFSPYDIATHDIAQLTSWNAPADYAAQRSGGPPGNASGPPPGWTPGWSSAPLGAPGTGVAPNQSGYPKSALFNS